jgi:hypothetical protein
VPVRHPFGSERHLGWMSLSRYRYVYVYADRMDEP